MFQQAVFTNTKLKPIHYMIKCLLMKRKKWKENKNLFVNNNVKLNKDKLKNNNKH